MAMLAEFRLAAHLTWGLREDSRGTLQTAAGCCNLQDQLTRDTRNMMCEVVLHYEGRLLTYTEA